MEHYYDSTCETPLDTDVISPQDFYEIGLSRNWGKLMDEVGFETFVLVWRALEDPRQRTMLNKQIRVPEFNLFKHPLRKKFVTYLQKQKLSPKEIAHKVLFVFGEELTEEENYKRIAVAA